MVVRRQSAQFRRQPCNEALILCRPPPQLVVVPLQVFYKLKEFGVQRRQLSPQRRVLVLCRRQALPASVNSSPAGQV